MSNTLSFSSPTGNLLDFTGGAPVAVDLLASLPSPLGAGSVVAIVAPPNLVHCSLVSPLGASAVVVVSGGGSVVYAQVPLLSPLKLASGLAEAVANQIRLVLPSPLGAVAVRVGIITESTVRLASPLGAIATRVLSKGDPWGSAGLPLPRMQDYQYTKDVKLVRAEMSSGGIRQRRRWVNSRRQATVSFEIPVSSLHTMEQFLTTTGYTWFGMRIVTGDSLSEIADVHSVRVIGNPTFGEMYGENIVATLLLEVA